MVRLNKEQKLKIKRQIIKTSKKHFSEKGYDNTRTKEIAKEVGIAEGTVFNYFDSKAAIFLEAMAEGHIIKFADKKTIDFNADASDIIYNYIFRSFKNLVLLPKKIVKELIGASITIAKKNPGMLKKLAQIDYNLIDGLEELIEDLITIKKIMKCDARIAAETVFSIVATEILLYMYEDAATKEKMLEKIKSKIIFVLTGFIL